MIKYLLILALLITPAFAAGITVDNGTTLNNNSGVTLTFPPGGGELLKPPAVGGTNGQLMSSDGTNPVWTTITYTSASIAATGTILSSTADVFDVGHPSTGVYIITIDPALPNTTYKVMVFRDTTTSNSHVFKVDRTDATSFTINAYLSTTGALSSTNFSFIVFP